MMAWAVTSFYNLRSIEKVQKSLITSTSFVALGCSESLNKMPLIQLCLCLGVCEFVFVPCVSQYKL